MHGISAEMLVGAPTFGAIHPYLADRLSGRVVVGHNVDHFDLGFMRAECRRLGGEVLVPGSVPSIDTLAVAQAHLGLQGRARLFDCCDPLRAVVGRPPQRPGRRPGHGGPVPAPCGPSWVTAPSGSPASCGGRWFGVARPSGALPLGPTPPRAVRPRRARGLRPQPRPGIDRSVDRPAGQGHADRGRGWPRPPRIAFFDLSGSTAGVGRRASPRGRHRLGCRPPGVTGPG